MASLLCRRGGQNSRLGFAVNVVHLYIMFLGRVPFLWISPSMVSKGHKNWLAYRLQKHYKLKNTPGLCRKNIL